MKSIETTVLSGVLNLFIATSFTFPVIFSDFSYKIIKLVHCDPVILNYFIMICDSL